MYLTCYLSAWVGGCCYHCKLVQAVEWTGAKSERGWAFLYGVTDSITVLSLLIEKN